MRYGEKDGSGRKARFWHGAEAAIGFALLSVVLVGIPTVGALASSVGGSEAGTPAVAEGTFSQPASTLPARGSIPEAAADAAAESMARQLFADGTDSGKELAAYRKAGRLNGKAVMGELAPLVKAKEDRERKAREAAARKARLAREAREAAARAASGGSGSGSGGRAYSGPAVAYRGGGTWSAAKVSSTLAAAARHYKLSASDTAWIVAKGTSVARKESTYRTNASNGQHLGLFQFNDDWGPASKRLDGTWSCYRFVKVMKDGGRSKINQHWAQTV